MSTTTIAPVVRRPRLGALSRFWPILPLLVFLGALFVYPLISLLWLSAVDQAGNLTVENYAKVASSPVYFSVILNTFWISLLTTVFSLMIAYPIAYLIITSTRRAQPWLNYLVLIPFWTSFLVRSFAWIVLLGRGGGINSLLLSTGVTDEPLSMLYSLGAVVVAMTQAMVPIAVVTMVPVMRAIDRKLESAAETLGSSKIHVFFLVFFPLSMPGIAAAGLLVFVTSLGFFITPALLGSRHETMISQVIITVMQELMNWRLAGALSMTLLVVTSLVFYWYDRTIGLDSLTGSKETKAASAKTGKSNRQFVLRSVADGLAWIARKLERIPALSAARGARAWRRLFVAVSVLLLLFLSVPTLVVLPISFTEAEFISFPPVGFSLTWYEAYWNSPVWIEATVRSVVVGLGTAVLSTILGVGAAFVLSWQRFAMKSVLLLLILTPMFLPRIIVAVALFYLLSTLGLAGTTFGLILAHTVVAAPYVVITVMAVLYSHDRRQEFAAWTLGANPWRTFTRVTLPQIKGGVLAGFLFAFVTSFDDLTIALFLTGGRFTTLPRQMWNDMLLQVNPTLAAVSAILLVAMSLVVLLAERLKTK